MSRKRPVTLDVREDIRRGREPFSRIMQTVAGLEDSQDLLLLAPFEPAPLYAMLAQQGFGHKTRPIESGDYEILFSRKLAGESGPSNPGSVQCAGPGKKTVIELDARGLEPPEPMVKILEAAATLPPGAELHARTDRRPMHLYAQLQERGFNAETESSGDGGFITYVRRR